MKKFDNSDDLIKFLEEDGYEIYDEFKDEVNDEIGDEVNDDKNKKRENLTKDEKNNKKTIKLLEKLSELQEKLKNEKLSPIKRAWILAKLSIIETKLENQLNKLEMKALSEKFETEKAQRNEKLGKVLKEKYEGCNNVLKKKLQLQREVEGLTSDIKQMEKEFKEINEAGMIKGQPIQFEFKVDDLTHDELNNKKEELAKISEEYKQMKAEVIQMKEEFAEKENENDEQNKMALKEYKPSFWKTIKTSFGRVKDVVKGYFSEKKEARDVVKKAKIEAKENYYKTKNDENLNDYSNKMKDFKEKLDLHIPQEEQAKFSKKVEEVIVENDNQQNIEDNQK